MVIVRSSNRSAEEASDDPALSPRLPFLFARMPVELFTDGLEPDDQDALIWRFMERWKFEDLLKSRDLYFCRADLFNDESEGLPPEAYHPKPDMHPLDIRDRRDIDDATGTAAQFREAFFINCWYLFGDETAAMWKEYGGGGVAIVSRYSLLKSALASLKDEAYLGLIRYGVGHLTGWNIMRFITTKSERYAHEREVRALLWIRDELAGINRHFDENNIAHPRPLSEPPVDRVAKAQPPPESNLRDWIARHLRCALFQDRREEVSLKRKAMKMSPLKNLVGKHFRNANPFSAEQKCSKSTFPRVSGCRWR